MSALRKLILESDENWKGNLQNVKKWEKFLRIGEFNKRNFKKWRKILRSSKNVAIKGKFREC
jgi:hypothetical protein